MRLIGMLDSPYVRRVAVSLEMLGIAFEHESISVFSTFAEFQALNPVVKAPTLICDDGTVLMDSSLILQFAEASLSNGRSLWTGEQIQLQHEFRMVSLAMAACEKSVQMIYETNLRPAAKHHEPWLVRVRGQLQAAYAAMEQELTLRPHLLTGSLNHGSIAAAIAWQFTRSLFVELVPTVQHPHLAALSARLEQHPAFLKYPPDGPGVPAV